LKPLAGQGGSRKAFKLVLFSAQLEPFCALTPLAGQGGCGEGVRYEYTIASRANIRVAGVRPGQCKLEHDLGRGGVFVIRPHEQRRRGTVMVRCVHVLLLVRTPRPHDKGVTARLHITGGSQRH